MNDNCCAPGVSQCSFTSKASKLTNKLGNESLLFKWCKENRGAGGDHTAAPSASSAAIVWRLQLRRHCPGSLTSEGEFHLPVRSSRQVGDPPQTHADGHGAFSNSAWNRPLHMLLLLRVLPTAPAPARAGPVFCLTRQIELHNGFPWPHGGKKQQQHHPGGHLYLSKY